VSMWRSLIVLALVAPAPAAWAYKCTRTAITSGPSLTWRARQVSWVLDSDLTGDIADKAATRAAIEASFQAWTDVPCSDLAFVLAEVRGDVVAEAPDAGPFENVVTFVASGWDYDRAIIALTTTTFDDRGQIKDADIELNDQHFEFFVDGKACAPAVGRMDLRNTLTHEVGHVLGLDHPPIGPAYEDATMYASAPPCETIKRSLADDDMAGLCAIYPIGAANQPCFPADGSGFVVVDEDDGLGCTTTGGALGPTLGALVLGWVARRERRARGAGARSSRGA
jgi:hypothetical protein